MFYVLHITFMRNFTNRKSGRETWKKGNRSVKLSLDFSFEIEKKK